MKSKILLCLLLACSLCLPACKSKTLNLAPNGAYTPTGQPTQQVLFVTDEAYKLAYTTVQSVFAFERDNRAAVNAISPQIKLALDKARPDAVDINLRWAKARQVYKQAPTPDGLVTIQGILQEIQILVPIVQEAIAPVYSTLNK